MTRKAPPRKTNRLSIRHFNQLEIDHDLGTVTKRSDNREKLVREIRWYLNLPPALKHIIPRVLDYSVADSAPFVKLELCPFPSLADEFLSPEAGLETWNRAIDDVLALVTLMRGYRAEISRAQTDEALREMYIGKTRQRLAELRSDARFVGFFTEPVTINGSAFEPLDVALATIEGLVSTKLLSGEPPCSLIHGDLCLSNILYDVASHSVRLVDPRGAFGTLAEWGDPRYELAKLSHSFNGRYELIVSDRFTLSTAGSRIDFEIPVSDTQLAVIARFNERLRRHYEAELGAVALIEALLFLSMVPLHQDVFERQIVMLATGVTKLHRILTGAAAA